MKALPQETLIELERWIRGLIFGDNTDSDLTEAERILLMSNSFCHRDLTEAQWNRIKFVFEEPEKFGRLPLNSRNAFNGILWIFKSGACCGNWNSIYHKFRQWCNFGLFERLLKIINGDTDNASLLEIDSTFKSGINRRTSSRSFGG